MNWQDLQGYEPWLQALMGLAVLGVVAYVLQWLANVLLQRVLQPVGQKVEGPLAILLHPQVLRAASRIVPPVVVHYGIALVPNLHPTAERVISNVTAALIVLTVATTLFRVLSVFSDHQLRKALATGEAQSRSIKMYVQVGQILIALAAIVVMVAALSDKSPFIVLSGFGAISAVLMLIFQDTIRSFAAGIQIQTNDLLRVGDWVEMPHQGVDGAVVEVALNTIKVQNWDMTIVSVPTWKLMSDSFKNWRGMSESGGRRIKRAIALDADGIRFLTYEDIAQLRNVKVLRDYIETKVQEVQQTHSQQASELPAAMASNPVNQRRLTNIGTFRAYAQHYIESHPSIHPGMMRMVRMMEPTATGVPIEIYCFTNTTKWVEYEAIQADIFDHLLSVLPEFGLRVFQAPSSGGIQAAIHAWRGQEVQAK